MINTEKIESNGKVALTICGYSDVGCIDLIRIIEKLSDDEEARIVCDEMMFIWAFESKHKFDKRKEYKLGVHDIVVNNKTMDRYKYYFNIESPIILIISNEFREVGIIYC